MRRVSMQGYNVVTRSISQVRRNAKDPKVANYLLELEMPREAGLSFGVRGRE